MIKTDDPHGDQPVMQMGAAIHEAQGAMVLLHGRGASAEDILSLASELDVPGFVFLAPQAASHSWYPNRFLAPLRSNEPWLTSALGVIQRILNHLKGGGIALQQVILLGFSQGACLALEYGARHPRRYGGLVGLSGGLIGADEELVEPDGSLEGTPVFLGCSPNDPHIPRQRFEDAARRLQAMEGIVTSRLYPGLGHSVNEAELNFVREMMMSLLNGGDVHAVGADGPSADTE